MADPQQIYYIFPKRSVYPLSACGDRVVEQSDDRVSQLLSSCLWYGQRCKKNFR